MSVEDRQTLAEVQAHFNLPSFAPVEKDIHVVRAIRALVAVDATPFRLVFGGGTSLARAHRLIRRMSEDVDFKIEQVDGTLLSRTALRKQLGLLRDRVTTALSDAAFEIVSPMPIVRNENHYCSYQLPYESTAPESAGLRPTIQVELTYAPLRTDVVNLPMASFVAEALGRTPEVPNVACVAVTETAAEKLISLTRRTAMQIAGHSHQDDATLVRHIYDLHVLHSTYNVSEVASLAYTIMKYDADVFANQYPEYREQPLIETRKAMNILRADEIHRKRFAAFQRDMVYGDEIDFDTALATVEMLVRQLEREQS